jgi:predicted anti-sigma-YlaC factor YlaD
MSHVPDRAPECEALNDDLIEFALGTLSGRSRASVLQHLESCAHCNAELDSMAGAADTLLWLAPEAEPSLGFETRLIERYRRSDPRQRVTRLRRASLLAVAAMLAVVMGVGLGAVFTGHGGTNPPVATRPLIARLMSNGQTLGDVTISSGSPSWMIMEIDAGDVSGPVWCEVTLGNGHNVTVGKFTISNGYGSWVAPFTSSSSGVRSARIVNAHGTVLAQATFAT